MTVEENLRLAANHVTDPLAVDLILDQFPELAAMRDRPSKNMSGVKSRCSPSRVACSESANDAS